MIKPTRDSKLTIEDLKKLRYQCRIGYISLFFILILGSIITVFTYESEFNKSHGLNDFIDALIVSAFAILVLVINYLKSCKYYNEIRNIFKIVQSKDIERKMSKKDFEAGSGNITTLPHNREMNEFIRYNLIIENTIQRVDESLFNTCHGGDKVLFYWAPKSKFLLGMVKA